MEVRDVFELRKEGRVEEAYRAISEIYAHHQGPHTNLCMFWCSSDMLRKYAKEKAVKSMRQMLGNMVKIYPTISDNRGDAARAIAKGALAMDKLVEDFNLIYFLPWFNKLAEEDWKPYTVDNHQVPSLGQQIVNHLMKDIHRRDVDYVNSVVELFRKAMEKAPHYKPNLRHYAQLHIFLGNSEKALDTYKMLLRRYHDSYLYGELARLVGDSSQKIALYCQAICRQPREEFRAKYHLELALLLKSRGLKSRAAYELGRCVAIRRRFNHQLTPFIQRQLDSLSGVPPVTEADEQALYDRSKYVVNKLLAE